MDAKKEGKKQLEKLTKQLIPELEKAHKFCSYHRDIIEQEAVLCGCFYCCTTFLPEKIIEWTDILVKRGGDGIRAKTALCPNCGIDSVLPWFPESPYIIDKRFLRMMCDYYF